MKAKKIEQFNFDMQPGTYCIDKGRLIIGLPCGHTFIPQGKWTEQDIEDENKITLSPSIFCSPEVPCWHGFLTNGEFKQV